jgi:hypothetical protein
MPVLLAALVAPVVVYCLGLAVMPTRGGRVDRHRRDIDAWHVVMGAAMLCMLLGDLSRPLATVALGLAGGAACWGALSTERRSGSGAHTRLLVGAAAMAVMTLPLAVPAAATSAPPASFGTSGMSMGGTPSALVVVLLVAALGMVTAARLPDVVRPSDSAVSRLDACCDVVMAGATAAMLAVLV